MFQNSSTDVPDLDPAQTYQLIASYYLTLHEGKGCEKTSDKLHSACVKLTQMGFEDEYTAQMVAFSENQNLAAFAAPLMGAALTFSDDENVLYFLIKNGSRFDALNGKGFMEKALLSMYPGGLDTLYHFLQCRYTERGFSRLLPTCHHNLSILDPSLPCRLSKNNTVN